ncbi:MAG TPA: hypothetical protein VH594_11245 [Trebonia sp.]
MRAGDGYPGQQAFQPDDLAGQSGWPPAQSSRPPAQSSQPPAESGWPPAQSSQPPAESSGPGAYPGGLGGYPGGPVTQPSGPVAQPGGPVGYPGGPGGFPGGPVTQPGGPVPHPGGPVGWAGGPVTQPGGQGGPPPVPGGQPQPPGPGGPPSGPGGPGKKAWPTWWIVPYLGGAAAVLVVFAIVQLTVLRHPAGHAAAASSTAAAAPQGPMPAQMFPDALFKQLTKDVQGNNEKDFLSLVAPAARPAVQTWWDNMQALGFTTGLVMPANKTDEVDLNSSGNGTATILAGTHNALDPVHNGHPDVPLERYQIGLHFSSAKAIGQITSWKPLGDDPWDQGKLYVRKADNVIVAGPTADSSVVDETLPIAQAAAAYDVGLINHVHPSDLRQEGFVVFVSGDPAVRNRWFSTTKQPTGWPPAFTSLTAQLPGPGASANTHWSLGNLANDTTGGARVVITPFEDQNGGSTQQETAELVTRFALDILSASNQDLFAGLAPPPSIPAWAIEGFGVAFEAAYDSNTNATPDEYSFKALNDALKKLPASYKNGDVPTADQLYKGPDQTQQNWRVVAASAYAYIATHYGMSQLLASAELMWTAEPDPRQNVLKSSTNQTFVMYGKDTIQSGWEAYLASPSDLAPLVGPAGV